MPANAGIAQEPAPGDKDGATIVGLWDVKFISEGQIVDEGFDERHPAFAEMLDNAKETKP